MSTLSQKISQRLAKDIVDGVLKPGAKLEEIVLAKRFKVSRSPVRDALRELAATGLIESQPRRGFSVATIDLAGLLDLFEAASEVEGLCAKLCALRAGMAEKKQIELVHSRARKAVLDGDADSYADLNESFHQSIYIGARNRNLHALAANLRQRLEPFRSQEFFNSGDRLQTSVAEHEVITKAILRADAGAAFDAMCAHTASSATNVIEYFEKQHGGGTAGNSGLAVGERVPLHSALAGKAKKSKAGKPRSSVRANRS
jgi:DNA-binding GntR family transcriptional regulator